MDNTHRDQISICKRCGASRMEGDVLICGMFLIDCAEVNICDAYKQVAEIESEDKLTRLQKQLRQLAEEKERRMNEETNPETQAYYKGKMHAYATIIDMIDTMKERG